jgi:hypothetical protein
MLKSRQIFHEISGLSLSHVRGLIKQMAQLSFAGLYLHCIANATIPAALQSVFHYVLLPLD